MRSVVCLVLVCGAFSFGPAGFVDATESEVQHQRVAASRDDAPGNVVLTEAQMDQVTAGESRPQRPRAPAQPRFFDFTDEPLIVKPSARDSRDLYRGPGSDIIVVSY